MSDESKISSPDPEEGSEILVSITGVPIAVVGAAEQIRDHMESLHNDQNYVVFLMAVHAQNAKTRLVPLPSPQNIVKLKQHIDQFPEAIKSALLDNIEDTDKQAVEAIWTYMKESSEVPGQNDGSPPSCPRVRLQNSDE